MSGQLNRISTLDTTETTGEPRPRNKPRGLPPALAPHRVYAASNPADASLFGQDLLGRHRVGIDSADLDGFQAAFHGVLFRDVTLGYLDYSTDVTVDVERLNDDQLVIVPACGFSTVTTGGRTVEASPVMGVVPRPGSELTLRCERDAAHLVVRIDERALETHLGRLLGRGIDRPIEFDLAFDLAQGSASRWNLAVQMLHGELYDPDSLLHRGVGLGHLEEFVMSALLYAHTSNYSEHLTLRARQPIRHTVRTACDFIEHQLATQIGVADIADACGVSVRTLQSHFTADLAQTPTAFLRNRRLERARDDLADVGPDSGVTVTDVALRWGFTHLGRFSVNYRRRFGESPSETLRS